MPSPSRPRALLEIDVVAAVAPWIAPIAAPGRPHHGGTPDGLQGAATQVLALFGRVDVRGKAVADLEAFGAVAGGAAVAFVPRPR